MEAFPDHQKLSYYSLTPQSRSNFQRYPFKKKDAKKTKHKVTFRYIAHLLIGHGPSSSWLVGENVRCSGAFLMEKGPGGGPLSLLTGSDGRDASRSASMCVTKHVCLWLTGWKQLSSTTSFHSNTQLRFNCVQVHNRDVAGHHPGPPCTCFNFLTS